VVGGGVEREGAAAGDSFVRASDRAAGVVVEVAELLVAHARAPAAMVVREDVVALEFVVGLVVVDGGIVHGYPPLFLGKIFKLENLGLDPGRTCGAKPGLKRKAPARAGASFVSISILEN